MGFGNLPCATHRLMVDLAKDVKSLTSAMRKSCLELVNFGLHWFEGKPMVPASKSIFSQELFLLYLFCLFANFLQYFAPRTLGSQAPNIAPIRPSWMDAVSQNLFAIHSLFYFFNINFWIFFE